MISNYFSKISGEFLEGNPKHSDLIVIEGGKGGRAEMATQHIYREILHLFSKPFTEVIPMHLRRRSAVERICYLYFKGPLHTSLTVVFLYPFVNGN